MENKIEVEIRSFISKERYEELIEFFKNNSDKTKEDFEETHYLESSKDIRIQKNNSFSKIWLKKGKIHDDYREEIEVNFEKDDFNKISKIFSEIGHQPKIKWFRYRNEFIWDEIKVCLDYTKAYGYIIELEKISTEQEKEKTLEELKEKLKELNIELTPKEEFNNKFEYYKNNWRELLK